MFLLAALLLTTPLEELEKIPAQTLVLVRHGECLFNIPDREGIVYISGQSNPVPLTEKGVEQARTLASRLIKKIDHPSVICSSTALRAHQTALCLFEQLGSLGNSYDGLCELGHGKWEGLPKDHLYKAELQKWERLSAKEKWLTPKVEGGESFAQVNQRALETLQEIVDQHRGQTLFVVTHFMTLNALTLHWSGAVEHLSAELGSAMPQQVFENGDLLVVEIPEKVSDAKILMHLH